MIADCDHVEKRLISSTGNGECPVDVAPIPSLLILGLKVERSMDSYYLFAGSLGSAGCQTEIENSDFLGTPMGGLTPCVIDQVIAGNSHAEIYRKSILLTCFR